MGIWKQINNYSKYEISDNGKVRNKEKSHKGLLIKMDIQQ